MIYTLKECKIDGYMENEHVWFTCSEAFISSVLNLQSIFGGRTFNDQNVRTPPNNHSTNAQHSFVIPATKEPPHKVGGPSRVYCDDIVWTNTKVFAKYLNILFFFSNSFYLIRIEFNFIGRLIISLGCRSSKWLDCSSSNMVRELGLERCKTVRSLSTVVLVSVFQVNQYERIINL